MKVYNIAKVFELVLCFVFLFFAIVSNKKDKWASDVRAIVKVQILFTAIVGGLFELSLTLIEKALGKVWIPAIFLLILWVTVIIVDSKDIKKIKV